jgi:hypothetical protein
MGASLFVYSTTFPAASFIRTQGIDCRCSSAAMKVTSLARFMCQWMPEAGPLAGLPPPTWTSIRVARGVFASS